jgi:hypothetical protein
MQWRPSRILTVVLLTLLVGRGGETPVVKNARELQGLLRSAGVECRDVEGLGPTEGESSQRDCRQPRGRIELHVWSTSYARARALDIFDVQGVSDTCPRSAAPIRLVVSANWIVTVGSNRPEMQHRIADALDADARTYRCTGPG